MIVHNGKHKPISSSLRVLGCTLRFYLYQYYRTKEYLFLSDKNSSVNHASMGCGLWVLCGFLVFVIAEKMFSGDSGDDQDEEELSPIDAPKKISIPHENNNCTEFDEFSKLNKNGHINGATSKVNGIKLNGQITKSNGMKRDLQQSGLKKQSNGVNGVKYCNGYTNRFTKSNGIKPVSNGYHSSNSTHG